MALSRRLWADREFIVFRGQRLTRRQVFARVDALAAGLQGLGVQKGNRVVTLLPACPEAVYALFLPWALGNVEVPLNPLLREHELRHILADCEASAVITTRRWHGHDYPAMLARLRPDLPHLRTIVVQGGGEGDGHTFFSLEEVMATGRSLRRVRVSPKETGHIAYTSGTTGLPKGVVHTRDGYWGLARPGVIPYLNPRLMRCLLIQERARTGGTERVHGEVGQMEPSAIRLLLQDEKLAILPPHLDDGASVGRDRVQGVGLGNQLVHTQPAQQGSQQAAARPSDADARRLLQVPSPSETVQRLQQDPCWLPLRTQIDMLQ